MSDIPTDLKYAKSHEWVRVEDDGSVTVGISDNAQEALGDMVFVEVPEAGQSLGAAESCAVVESVKAASDVYCPLAGEVTEGNAALESAPELVNNDPYGEGWLFKLKPENLDDLDSLLSAEEYEKVSAE